MIVSIIVTIVNKYSQNNSEVDFEDNSEDSSELGNVTDKTQH